MSATLEAILSEQWPHLSIDQQRQVVELARTLATTPLRGVPGTSLLEFAGRLEAEEAAVIAHAIADGCEQVDVHAW